MDKASFVVIGKDYITNKPVEHTIVAKNPSEAKIIASQKYPRFVVEIVYPAKFNFTADLGPFTEFDDS
jgi:hypothetical protein